MRLNLACAYRLPYLVLLTVLHCGLAVLQEVREPEHPSQTLRLLRGLKLALLICRQETLHTDMLGQASRLAEAVARFRWGGVADVCMSSLLLKTDNIAWPTVLLCITGPRPALSMLAITSIR